MKLLYKNAKSTPTIYKSILDLLTKKIRKLLRTLFIQMRGMSCMRIGHNNKHTRSLHHAFWHRKIAKLLCRSSFLQQSQFFIPIQVARIIMSSTKFGITSLNYQMPISSAENTNSLIRNSFLNQIKLTKILCLSTTKSLLPAT